MNSKDPLVSIIVPIYNAELFLADCLSSIASQTYENIEVILINDGSTDDSYNIAKSFCDKNSKFQLVTQVNSGVAGARERGLRLARGEYVIHTDADDLMTERAIEYLYKSIVDSGSNISIGSYIDESKHSHKVVSHSEKNKNIFIHNILTGKYHSSLCNKLIRMDLCEKISFDNKINYMEDKLFLLKVLKKDETSISITDEIVYFYRKVDNSYTNKITHESILSSIKVTGKICNIFKDEYSDVFIAHLKNKNRVMVLLNSKITQRDVFPESIKYFFSDKELPLKHKIIILLDVLHMGYFIRFYRFLSLNIINKSV